MNKPRQKCTRLEQNKRDKGDKNAQDLDKITGMREEQTRQQHKTD